MKNKTEIEAPQVSTARPSAWMVAGWLLTVAAIGWVILQNQNLNKQFEQLTKELEERVVIEVAEYTGQHAPKAAVAPEVKDGVETLLDEWQNSSEEIAARTPGDVTPAPPPSPEAASIEELLVTNVDKELNLVALNGGVNLGIGKLANFEIIRDGEVIADVKTVHVEEDMTVAQITTVKTGSEIRKGDRVVRKVK